MEELLKLKERIDIAIEIGESYYREFKSALVGPPDQKTARDIKEVCYDIGKTLVAFANADGGELFVGIEDDNTITGLPYSEDKNSNILKAYQNYVLSETPLPVKRASLIDYNGKKVAYFSVEKGSRFVHLTSKGECFQRKDRESIPTASELIRFAREEELSREYDRQFVDLASISDLDIELVVSVSQNLFRSMTPEKFLQYLELAEYDGTRLRLRRAALLLFAKHPTKWHPRNQVRILKVRGIEEKSGENFNVEETGEVSGNIFTLIVQSWELLRPHLAETRLSKDAIFRTQIIYPELACREALINAITHRDYSLEGRGIEVKIYDDRLEILSPGKLLSSLTIKDLEELKGVHQSRNTYIARVLREFGYIRELGEGIKRIFDLMKSNDLVKPKIESPNKSFIVTLFNKLIYSKEEKLWLEQFENFGLSREQKTVVRLGMNGRLVSTKEIFDEVGIVSEDYYRQLIESLRKIGILDNKLSKSDIIREAKKRNISRKSVPRYQILSPLTDSYTSLRSGESDTSDYARVFVGNLPSEVTEEEIEQAFKQYGEISDIVIPKDRTTGKSRGFCFIEFEKKESAANVLNSAEPVYIRGRKSIAQEFRRV
ncbi:MAG: putative DNA binding domain-containing protein [Ignavibacteriaceae bacterium]|nr:putative DNA binding domain-containing protein [Ignavibacteriaceae bacterium]